MNVTEFVASLSGSSFVVTRSIGTFHFDAVTRESHASTLRLTDNPVESGEMMVDHAVLEPKEVKITGIMVGYTPPDYLYALTGLDVQPVKRFPLPIDVNATTEQAKSMIGRYASTAVDAKEKATQGFSLLSPRYTQDKSATMDRVGMAYEQLLMLQKSGEFIEILTGVRRYNNMLITGISLLQTVDQSAEFEITVREAFIAESQTVSDRNSLLKIVQKGRTTPKKVDATVRNKKSVLKDLFG